MQSSRFVRESIRSKGSLIVVVVAVDGSGHTQKVKEVALGLVSDSSFHFLHVAESYIYPSMVADGVIIDLAAIRDRQRAQVWEAVGDLPPGSEKIDLEGPVVRTIVEYAKEVGAELIVIGSRGRGAFGSLVLGSVSQGVVHGAECSVLIVK